MKFCIKKATAKSGRNYTALVVIRNGIEKVVTFDIEVILLVSGLTVEGLYNLPIGITPIKI